MEKNYLRLIIILTLTVLTSACATSFRHSYLMRGQVIDFKAEDSIIVCVGTNEGAEAGQILDVHRFMFQKGSTEDGEDLYLETVVGKVIIEEVINEHYAKAKILEGDILKNDTVQLNR